MRAVNKAIKDDKVANAPKDTGPATKEVRKTRRLQSEAVDMLMGRKKADIGEFRKSRRKITEDKLKDSKKQQATKSDKDSGYERPPMTPMGGSMRVASQKPKLRRRMPSEDDYERNAADLEKSLLADEVEEQREIAVGDRVTLTKDKLKEVEKSGDIASFPLTTGIVNDINNETLTIDFGGTAMELQKNEVEFVKAEPKDDKLGDSELVKPVSADDGGAVDTTDEADEAAESDEDDQPKNNPEEMFI